VEEACTWIFFKRRGESYQGSPGEKKGDLSLLELPALGRPLKGVPKIVVEGKGPLFKKTGDRSRSRGEHGKKKGMRQERKGHPRKKLISEDVRLIMGKKNRIRSGNFRGHSPLHCGKGPPRRVGKCSEGPPKGRDCPTPLDGKGGGEGRRIKISSRVIHWGGLCPSRSSRDLRGKERAR